MDEVERLRQENALFRGRMSQAADDAQNLATARADLAQVQQRLAEAVALLREGLNAPARGWRARTNTFLAAVAPQEERCPYPDGCDLPWSTHDHYSEGPGKPFVVRMFDALPKEGLASTPGNDHYVEGRRDPASSPPGRDAGDRREA